MRVTNNTTYFFFYIFILLILHSFYTILFCFFIYVEVYIKISIIDSSTLFIIVYVINLDYTVDENLCLFMFLAFFNALFFFFCIETYYIQGW